MLQFLRVYLDKNQLELGSAPRCVASGKELRGPVQKERLLQADGNTEKWVGHCRVPSFKGWQESVRQRT